MQKLGRDWFQTEEAGSTADLLHEALNVSSLACLTGLSASATRSTMYFQQGSATLIFVLLIVTFVITLPFGYWRERCRRFTLEWWLAIHLVIPFIFFMRHWGGYSFLYIPAFLYSTVIGQIVGGRIRRAIKSQ